MLVARDEGALALLEIQYAQLCSGIMRGVLSNPGDVEECLNDTMLAVWNSIPPADPDIRGYHNYHSVNISFSQNDTGLSSVKYLPCENPFK